MKPETMTPIRGGLPSRLLRGAAGALVILGLIVFMPPAARATVDLADAPMETKFQPAPANLMVVWDDSGSMDLEFLSQVGESGYPGPPVRPTYGVSNNSGKGYNYLFGSAPGNVLDNVYFNFDPNNSQNDYYRYLEAENRSWWKTRWHQVNMLYYNPAVTYTPWPTLSNADPTNPRSHPRSSAYTFNLDATAYNVPATTGTAIPQAHYYLWSESAGKPYLVALSGGTIKYYAVNQVLNEQILVNGVITSVSGAASRAVDINYWEKVTQIALEANPPSDVKTARTYTAERQNFANWFSFYRRRRGTAVAALSNSLVALSGVRVGILGMNVIGKPNEAIKKPLAPLKLRFEGTYYDSLSDLLTTLYDRNVVIGVMGNTPTSLAFEKVGNYYKNNPDNLEGVSGIAAPYKTPFFPENKGGACQQCYTIIVTDGLESPPPSLPPYDLPTSVGSNADGDNGYPYADSWSKTMADVAMYFYENDLNASLPNKVVPNRYDPATWQHMVTYAVTMGGVFGTLDPADYDRNFENPDLDLRHKTTGARIVWPEPVPKTRTSIDALWHATVNGRGQYLNGTSYQELADTLKQVIQNIAARIGSSSSISVNGDQLFGKITDEILLFQSIYNTTNWTGDVRAHTLNTTTGAVIKTDINGDPVYEWSAAQQLDARDWTTRAVATYNPDSGAGIAFDYANLTATQKSALDPNATIAQNIVNYVKGQAIAGFRERSSRLGDIVHSSPVFSGTTLYVGANDGMLHAFNTENGQERFAYVPSMVIANLKNLKESSYAHNYFVDQTPTVKKGDRLLGGGADDIILVGGLGKGGKGYYALNVTDPAAMNAPANVAAKVLWEYPRGATPSDEKDDIGYSYSRPVVVKSNDPAYPWVVIFGNGYESSRQDPVLFILNAQSGTLVKKITAMGASDSGLSTPIAVDADKNGTVDFVYAGDLQGNMWKFDLTSTSKNDWAVAFKNASNVAQPLFKAKGPGGSVQPITTKPDVMYHPRYHGYMVVFGTGKYLADVDYSDTSTQSVYGIWDYGDRWYNGTTSTPNGFSPDDDREYVGEFNRASTAKLSNLDQKISLLQQTRVSDLVVGGATYRVLSANQPLWKLESDATTGQMPNPSTTQQNHAGWYFDLPITRERVISDVSLREGKVIVISYTPDSDPCQAGGKSFLMELDADTGGALRMAQFDIDGDRSLTPYRLNPNGSLASPGDYVNLGTSSAPNMVVPAGLQFEGNLQPPAILRLNSAIEIKYSSSSTGKVETVSERGVRLGVGYWRELED